MYKLYSSLLVFVDPELEQDYEVHWSHRLEILVKTELYLHTGRSKVNWIWILEHQQMQKHLLNFIPIAKMLFKLRRISLISKMCVLKFWPRTFLRINDILQVPIPFLLFSGCNSLNIAYFPLGWQMLSQIWFIPKFHKITYQALFFSVILPLWQ